jgi:IS5 family transposase
MRFLGPSLGDRVPDAKTVWLYRDALAQAGKVEELFELFDGHLNRKGYIARGGQILDASIVPVPRNHNTRDENAAIKKGEVPDGWTDKPAKRVQKDVDARWTKKHGKSHYGYKNHVNVDRKHKLVRRYHVSDAALHDSQAVDHLLMRGNTASGVWADAAYRSAEMEAKLRDRKLMSHIHRKGKRGKPLTKPAKGSNWTKSTVRVRVEHVFGAQTNDMGGTMGLFRIYLLLRKVEQTLHQSEGGFGGQLNFKTRKFSWVMTRKLSETVLSAKTERTRLHRSDQMGVDQTERRAKPAFKTRNRAQIPELWQAVPKRLDP